VIGDEEVRRRVREMKIGDRIDSDHHPLQVWVEGSVERERVEGGGERAGRVIWHEVGCSSRKS